MAQDKVVQEACMDQEGAREIIALVCCPKCCRDLWVLWDHRHTTACPCVYCRGAVMEWTGKFNYLHSQAL